MKRYTYCLFIGAAFAALTSISSFADEQQTAQPTETQLTFPLQTIPMTMHPDNCVNPGGGCDGSVPCCAPTVNACFNGRCVPVPHR